MNLLKIVVSRLAKYYHLNLGKLFFEKKVSDKSLIKILIETRAQHEVNAQNKEK